MALPSSAHINKYHDDHKKAVAVKKAAMKVEYESSDDEYRHFKRRPARYEPSPAPEEYRERRRHSKGETKERKHRKI